MQLKYEQELTDIQCLSQACEEFGQEMIPAMLRSPEIICLSYAAYCEDRQEDFQSFLRFKPNKVESSVHRRRGANEFDKYHYYWGDSDKEVSAEELQAHLTAEMRCWNITTIDPVQHEELHKQYADVVSLKKKCTCGAGSSGTNIHTTWCDMTNDPVAFNIAQDILINEALEQHNEQCASPKKCTCGSDKLKDSSGHSPWCDKA